VEIYLHTKFRLDISIYGRDKTVSGSGQRTAAILQLYFRFWFWPNFRHQHVFLRPNVGLPNFVKTELWRHIHFSRWRPAAILDSIWVIINHPRSVKKIS